MREGLRRVPTLVRGPKPAAALRELGIEPSMIAREPATWKEVLSLLSSRKEDRVAVLEYGRPDARLLAGLTEQGKAYESFPIYQYAFPEDSEPLKLGVGALAKGDFNSALFTSSIQLDHVLQIAFELGLEAETLDQLRRIQVISIGPTMSEALRAAGIEPSFQPSISKMGVLLHELDQRP